MRNSLIQNTLFILFIILKKFEFVQMKTSKCQCNANLSTEKKKQNEIEIQKVKITKVDFNEKKILFH